MRSLICSYLLSFASVTLAFEDVSIVSPTSSGGGYGRRVTGELSVYDKFGIHARIESQKWYDYTTDLTTCDLCGVTNPDAPERPEGAPPPCVTFTVDIVCQMYQSDPEESVSEPPPVVYNMKECLSYLQPLLSRYNAAGDPVEKLALKYYFVALATFIDPYSSDFYSQINSLPLFGSYFCPTKSKLSEMGIDWRSILDSEYAAKREDVLDNYPHFIQMFATKEIASATGSALGRGYNLEYPEEIFKKFEDLVAQTRSRAASTQFDVDGVTTTKPVVKCTIRRGDERDRDVESTELPDGVFMDSHSSWQDYIAGLKAKMRSLLDGTEPASSAYIRIPCNDVCRALENYFGGSTPGSIPAEPDFE